MTTLRQYCVLLLLHQADGSKLLHGWSEEIRGRGHVIHMIAVSGVVFVELGEQILQLKIELLVAHIAAEVIDTANEFVPDRQDPLCRWQTSGCLPTLSCDSPRMTWANAPLR